jgi:hypothetical protein|tara:strand:+ start:1010 stop:1522 length:513 start_codon:yes stop_codon:yes gene_type:complete
LKIQIRNKKKYLLYIKDIMKMSKKITPRQIGITLAVAVVIYLIFTNMSSGSTYSVEERMYAPLGDGPSPTASAVADTSASCEMKSGSGLASSLLPREVASQEEFGEFAPEDILAGQNFLEPRAQIGFPETVGGALRNANQQVRADPPNGKEPFVWNNSTISPDTMRRPLC